MLSKCFVRKGWFGWWLVYWFHHQPRSELGCMSGTLAKFRNEGDARRWCAFINIKRGHDPEPRLDEGLEAHSK